MTSAYETILARADHPAQDTPATEGTFVIGEIQYDAAVTEVTLIPAEDQPPDAVNLRTFTVVNTGGDAVDDIEIATLTTATGWVRGDEIKLILDSTPENLQVVANDVLGCVETVSGTGATHPAIQVTVKGRRN